ncbi:MAG: T9SS type A sorting domain-containing protein [Flavobacteriales bacterium]|nr:T9SS type A sorting domain-containing protein [Flavobacteriales bacterium]
MIRRYFIWLSGVAVVCVIVLTSATSRVASNGAPASSTGAPGEHDCTTSGCHTTYAVNTGTGILSMQVGDGSGFYVPGETYSVQVELSEKDVSRFGFEWVALRKSDQANAGTITVTDPNRNWVVPGFNSFDDRRYATYTYAGSVAPQTGSNSWQFDWTAPATDEGDITLYLAGVAANNDGTDLGDQVYTTTLTLVPAATGISNQIGLSEFQVYPVPAKDMLHVSFVSDRRQRVTMDLLTLEGKSVMMQADRVVDAGSVRITIPLNVAPGVYLLRMKDGGGEITLKKIMVVSSL